MESLPAELLIGILNNLEIKEILKCKQLNKKFNTLISDLLKLDCLVILNEKNYIPANKKWFGANKKINCLHWISKSNYKFLYDPLCQNLFFRVKKLFIYKKNVTIRFLNNFKKLQQLQIQSNLKCEEDDDILNQERLKILSISNNDDDLALNTPKLEMLNIIQFNLQVKFKVIYLQSVKVIKISTYRMFVKKFFNLQILYCKFIQTIDSDFVDKLKNLKEIHLDFSAKTVLELIRQRTALERNELVIYLLGFNYLFLNDLDKSALLESAAKRSPSDGLGNSLNKENVKHYRLNYLNLSDNLQVEEINYNCLENEFKLNFPFELCKKLVNVNKIEVNEKVKNQDDFYDFLIICYSFKKLTFVGITLNQDFFDNILPFLCPNIEKLSFYDCICHLDFNFLLKFKSIGTLKTNFLMPISFYKKLFQTYSSLKIANQNDNANFWIFKIGKSHYQLNSESIGKYSFEHVEDLFRFYKKYCFGSNSNITKIDQRTAKQIDIFDSDSDSVLDF